MEDGMGKPEFSVLSVHHRMYYVCWHYRTANSDLPDWTPYICRDGVCDSEKNIHFRKNR